MKVIGINPTYSQEEFCKFAKIIILKKNK